MPQDLNEIEQRMLRLSATEEALAGDLDNVWRIEAEERLAKVKRGESNASAPSGSQ